MHEKNVDLVTLNQQLQDPDALIQERNRQLTAEAQQLEEKERQLQENNQQLQDKDALIYQANLELIDLNQQLQARDALIHERNLQFIAHAQQLQERDRQIHEKNLQLVAYAQQLQEKEQQHKAKEEGHLQEREQLIQQHAQQLAEKEQQIRERDTLVHERNLQHQLDAQQLEEKEQQIRERDTLVHERNLQRLADVQQLEEKEQQLQQHAQQLQERSQQIREKNLQLITYTQQLQEKEQQHKEREGQLQETYAQQLKQAIQQQHAKDQIVEARTAAKDRVIKEKEEQIATINQQLKTAEQKVKSLGQQFYLKERQVQLKVRQLQDRDHEIHQKNLRIQELAHQLQEKIVDVQNKEQLIQSLAKGIEDFGQSGSYKLGRALSWPLRAVKQKRGTPPNGSEATNGFNPSQPQPDATVVARQTQTAAGISPATEAAYDYGRWVQLYDTLTDEDRETILAHVEGLDYKPLISIVMPVYNVEEVWLRKAIESMRRQLYPFWELCIADDNSTQPHVRRVLEKYAGKDERIKVVYRTANGHISAASNSALELATGEFIALLDNDDELPEHALYLIVEELNEHPESDLIYSDEDKIDENGVRREPHFKSDWNPDLFYSCNTISHLGVYRAAIVKKIGGFREGYEGSQDYDLALRFTEQIPESHIRHIPRILYHWRAIAGSVALAAGEKNYAHEAARNAIRSHFKRTGVKATVAEGHNNFHRVIYPVPDPAPLVSLIVATRDRLELLSQTVEGLLKETDYDPIEIIIVDNLSKNTATLKYLREVQKDRRVKVIEYAEPFNFSAINNFGVGESSGKIIGLINNDIKVISPGWLKEMVSHALRPEIGAVGAKLLYPDDRVQHAGVILGVYGVAAHAHRFIPKDSPGYINRAMIIQNLSAVTGACMILRREVYEEIGGLDEVNLSVAFNDIDLCIRIREKGYRIVWTPYAELYHVESASRGRDDTPDNAPRFSREIEYMMHVWGDALKSDPYYNPNLTMIGEDFSLAVPPRIAKKW